MKHKNKLIDIIDYFIQKKLFDQLKKIYKLKITLKGGRS